MVIATVLLQFIDYTVFLYGYQNFTQRLIFLKNNGEISKTLNEYPILPVKTLITRIPSFKCKVEYF